MTEARKPGRRKYHSLTQGIMMRSIDPAMASATPRDSVTRISLSGTRPPVASSIC